MATYSHTYRRLLLLFNARFSIRQENETGWWRFTKFLLVWVPLTAISTLAVTWVASSLGLAHAWLAKPLVEGVLAVVAFFLWRHVVYR